MRKLAVVLIPVVLLSMLGLFYVLQPSKTTFSPTYAANAEINASYHPGNSTVSFAVTNGILSTYTDEDGGGLVFTSENLSSETEEISSNLTVRGYGEKNKEGLWATPPEKFLGLTMPTSALTTLPVEENETVEITGVENGDQIFLYRKENEYSLLAEMKVTENTVKRGFWATNTEVPEFIKNRN